MGDYIERQVAIDAILGITPMRNTIPLDSAIFNIKKLPSADVQPVRHGHWILQEDRTKKLYGWHICSECGAWIGKPTNYCSNCGADMRGEQNG